MLVAVVMVALGLATLTAAFGRGEEAFGPAAFPERRFAEGAVGEVILDGAEGLGGVFETAAAVGAVGADGAVRVVRLVRAVEVVGALVSVGAVGAEGAVAAAEDVGPVGAGAVELGAETWSWKR